jgi:hypothetical protein
LDKAQALFSGQNIDGKATKTSAAGLAADITTNPVIVTDNFDFTGTDSVTIETYPLTVAATLTLKSATAAITLKGNIFVKEGGTLILNPPDPGTTKIGTRTDTSKIELFSGATLIEKTPAAGSFGDFKGINVVHTGAILIINDNALNGRNEETVFIGPASGSNSGQILQLNSGTAVVGEAGSNTSYPNRAGTDIAVNGLYLDGDATLVHDYEIRMNMILNAASTLTIASGKKLSFDTTYTLAATEGARIVLHDGASITLNSSSDITAPALETGKGPEIKARIVDNDSTPKTASLIGPMVLQYNGTSWVKQ